MMLECPGAGRFKQPVPEIINCPYCKQEMEIWSDEARAICPSCKKEVMRQGDTAGCLDWCKYARECVGDKLYARYLENKSIMLKDKIIKALENYFGQDKKRIRHARKVMDYAEEILRKEQADWHIVIPAALLHDVGIEAAEQKYGSSAGHYQEREGPAIAKETLRRMGLEKKDIDEICLIIANHHSPGKVNTDNFRVLYDADWLVNLKDEVKTGDSDKLREMINKIFLTATGKKLAEEIYLQGGRR
ncbi:MAG: HD domain-containing protein [Candidatus Omnitrophica bacterium]|nr:HD domain-containing protein [Candidatus Omnitrophota bacterium]